MSGRIVPVWKVSDVLAGVGVGRVGVPGFAGQLVLRVVLVDGHPAVGVGVPRKLAGAIIDIIATAQRDQSAGPSGFANCTSRWWYCRPGR